MVWPPQFIKVMDPDSIVAIKNSPPKKGVAVLCRVVLVKEWTSGNYQASSSSSLHSRHNVAKTIMKLQIIFQKNMILWYVSQSKDCKSKKQNTKFSHITKNQRNFVHSFALASKSGWIKKERHLLCQIANENHQVLFLIATTF